MKIITIAGSKGGQGRSTISMNLAYCLAQNTTVCASDLDLQGSLSKFRDIIPLQLVTIDEILRGRDEQYAIIDTPPYLSNRLPDLINKSDFVLVPVKPGFFDAFAVRETLALLKNSKHAIVLSMVQHHTSLARETLEILSDYGSPILTTRIHQRVAYTRSPITGSVFNSEDEKAKEEITSLALEILQSINQES